MADGQLLPLALFLLVAGVSALVRPDWHAAIERRRRTSMSKTRLKEIELSESWYGLTQGIGLIMTVVGVSLLLNSLL